MSFESFYKGEKEKILLSKQCGTYDYPFSFFLKLVHVLNATENIIITNKLVRLDGLTNIVLT